MEIRYLNRPTMDAIDRELIRERALRVRSPDREHRSDFALLFEPQECFTIHRSEDTTFIRDKKMFDDYAARHAIPVHCITRGGGIMWHGPGQAILEPFIDVKRRKINLFRYRWILEETCIQTLARFGVSAFRNPYCKGAQGVWVRNQDDRKRKIAFLGYSDSGGIVIHGCALNIAPPDFPLSLIYPCNLRGIEMTHMRALLGKTPPIRTVLQALSETFIKILEKE